MFKEYKNNLKLWIQPEASNELVQELMKYLFSICLLTIKFVECDGPLH